MTSQKVRLFDILFLLVLLFIISCSGTEKKETLELKTNPFEPNFDTTVDNLKQWGFEGKSFDDGVCVYSKNIADRIEMYFYLDFDDDCYKTSGQGIIIQLDTLGYHATRDEMISHNDDKWFSQNEQEFQKDSLKIIEILKAYNGLKISDTERLGYSTLVTFKARANDSDEIYECTYTAYPQNQKTLTFEKAWTNN